MPTLEEALNGSVIEESPVIGGINDRLTIDIESREIHIPESELLLGVESDEKGERKYFEIPRYVGNNLDLWELGLRVVYYNAQGKEGMYVVTDKQLEGDKITFSWELYRSVTEYKGNVEFLVCAVKTQADGTYANEWNTTPAIGIVKKGLEKPKSDEVDTVARDLVEQLLYIVNNSISDVEQATEEQKQSVYEQIEQKAADTLKTIPEDYSTMDRQVKRNVEDIAILDKATAIVQTVRGKSPIVVTDSSRRRPQGLTLFGGGGQNQYEGHQLFDKQLLLDNGGVEQSDGSIYMSQKHFCFYTNETNAIEQYAFSMTVKKENANTNPVLFKVVFTDGTEYFIFSAASFGTEFSTAVFVTSFSKVPKEIWLSYGSSDNFYVKDIMVNKGTEVKPTEPFVGGEASPSMNYPQYVVGAGQKLVEGNQLFDASKFQTTTVGNVTVTNNGDGSLTIGGEGNQTERVAIVYELTHEETVKMFKSGYLYVDFGSISYPYFSLELRHSGGSYGGVFNLTGTSGRFNITQEMLDDESTVFKAILSGALGQPIVPATLKPMLYQDGDGTWEPYTGGVPKAVSVGSIKNSILNKNLWNSDFAHNPNNWKKCTVQDWYWYIPIKAKKGEEITVSYMNNLATGLGMNCALSSTNEGVGSIIKWLYNNVTQSLCVNEVTLTLQQDEVYLVFYSEHTGINSVDIELFEKTVGNSLQIEYGGTKTEYQEGTEQSLTSILPNGLLRIPLGTTIPDEIKNSPIHMSGVYWDSVEQQYYIADTREYGNGRDVQRIGETIFDGDEYFVLGGGETDEILPVCVEGDVFGICRCNAGMCDKFILGGEHIIKVGNFDIRPQVVTQYNLRFYVSKSIATTVEEFKTYIAENPITLTHILAEPIITDISPEEMEEYNNLVMNHPNTVFICDDDRVTAELVYGADEAIYIDKRIGEKTNFKTILDVTLDESNSGKNKVALELPKEIFNVTELTLMIEIPSHSAINSVTIGAYISDIDNARHACCVLYNSGAMTLSTGQPFRMWSTTKFIFDSAMVASITSKGNSYTGANSAQVETRTIIDLVRKDLWEQIPPYLTINLSATVFTVGTRVIMEGK